jgi:predicted  nucleic acid-binding Zn-ribbon protein
VGTNPLEIDEVNELIHAVDEHLDSRRRARDLLDEVKDAAACRDLDAQIRDLQDQQRMLSKRWRELTEGFQSKE